MNEFYLSVKIDRWESFRLPAPAFPLLPPPRFFRFRSVFILMGSCLFIEWPSSGRINLPLLNRPPPPPVVVLLGSWIVLGAVSSWILFLPL